MFAAGTTIFEGIPQAFTKLREQAPLAIVTSNLGRITPALIDEIGLRVQFPDLIAPMDDHTLVSRKIALQRARGAAGARPAATVRIGDSARAVT